MAVLWSQSLVPFLDPNGDPYSSAVVYFYDAGTTTPLTVYQDAGLSVSHPSPVPADSSGTFPAIFLPPTTYHLRIELAPGGPYRDVDNIDAPQAASYVPPGAGTTDPTLLFATGDIKARHGTGAHTGWVRLAGRTIGNAASGATERANADTSALFQFLWSADTTLAVSGGRGATAAGDYAANKKIDLPDYRGRVPAGLASMGNTASTNIPDAQVDGGETADTLGATVGASTQTLTTAQIPAHTHTATTDTTGAHTHTTGVVGTGFAQAGASSVAVSGAGVTGSAGAHSHVVTVSNAGGGGSHPNVQPTILATYYIKL